MSKSLAGCGKTLRSPFDELRANGGALEIIDDFPFMLRLSKHENHFFRSLLNENNQKLLLRAALSEEALNFLQKSRHFDFCCLGKHVEGLQA